MKMSRGAWALIIGMLLFLGFSVWIAVQVWTNGEPVEISGHGILALVITVLGVLGVSGVLMGLLFYSSRKNLDQ